MMPKIGQHVKCILRNGAIAEGISQSDWMNSVVQLLSLDGESVIIIPHPNEDIMLIKIVLDRPKAEEVAEDVQTNPPQDLPALEQKFEEAREATDPHDINAVRSLAELRIELNKQERRIIADKLREHRPTAYSPGTTPYHYPSVVTGKPSPYQPGRIPNGRTNKKPSTK